MIAKRLRLLVAVVAVFLTAFAALWLIFPLPPHKPYSLVVYDSRDNILCAFLASDGAWRLRTTPAEIPERLKQIIIQKEDRYFYYHFGINPVAVVRALAQNIRSGKRISGASTITMQVARMLEPKERTYANKLIEMFRAVQLELKYSKDEILEMYLSLLPLGGNIEGLKSAALIYYQTPIERLNIAQLFDLTLIPNNPNGLRPDRFPDRLLQERARRASRFFAAGIFDKRDSLVFTQIAPAGVRGRFITRAPHFCLRVKGLARDRSDVHSTLNPQIQYLAERTLTHHMHGWKLRGVQNGALIAVENKSMNVVAYVGSEDFSDSLANGQVDAVQAIRSPGSALKPFLYSFLMDRGTLTPKTRLLDVPYDAEGYTAENYDGTFSGTVFADEALQRSLNVPMVRLLKNVGLGPFADFLKSVGFQSLDAQRPRLGLSMILGGCGVTLEELTTAYAAFANSGQYAAPRYVADTSGVCRTRVFSDAAAFMVTDILSGLRRPDMPNNFESAVNLPRAAFKTGTSYGRRDAWAIGYTAEYTVGVWVGNVTNKGNPDLVASKAAAPLLIDVLNSISRGNQKSILPMPADVNTRDVCAESGKLPTPRCKHLVEEYYSISHTIPRLCDVDNEYLVSADGKRTYCSSCLGNNNYRVVAIRDYPKELLNFWRKTGKPLTLAPPHNPACPRMFAGEGPKIISPSNEMTYLMISGNDKIALQASSGVDVREQYWYIDNRYLGRVKAGNKIFKGFTDGQYLVSCLDDKGRLSSVTISVKHL
jgi:penicillin-binding protein 1C